MSEDNLPPQVPLDLGDATPEELAAFGLRKDIAWLCDELHDAIEAGLSAERLHDIVGLWEANHSDLTLDALVAWGRPCACTDCGVDVTPYDEDGRLIEGASEWYMVEDAVWRSAVDDERPAQYLCLGCLAGRIGRPLQAADFSDAGVNEPSFLDTPRLHELLVRRAESDGKD